MYMCQTQCCAIQEIDGLSSHRTPEAAMKNFCTLVFTKPVKFGGTTAGANTLYSFYMFTAAIKPTISPYGNKFAAFIREHKLGEVLETKQVRNSAFHPDRAGQVWIWTPDQEALKAWWDTNKGGGAQVSNVKVEYVAAPGEDEDHNDDYEDPDDDDRNNDDDDPDEED